jgi:ADP-heptose:LPS heptosyltransferase
MPYFDGFYDDKRGKSIKDLIKLRRFLIKSNFSWVFDFQATTRSCFYHALYFPQKAPLWSGCAPKGSHYIGPASFDRVHVMDRLQKQLHQAGISDRHTPLLPDIHWLTSDIPLLPKPYVLMVPGSSKAHPGKRWPHLFYEEIAVKLIEKGFHIGLIGGPDEKEVLLSIARHSSKIHNFMGTLSFGDIATLGRHAAFAIGNDTGPSHLIAATGQSTVYCWSGLSQPNIFAPRGSHVKIIYEKNLQDLKPATLWDRLHHEHLI